jgi:hypothetical protein
MAMTRAVSSSRRDMTVLRWLETMCSTSSTILILARLQEVSNPFQISNLLFNGGDTVRVAGKSGPQGLMFPVSSAMLKNPAL